MKHKKTKSKILFLDHTPFVGGAQLSLLQHIEYLDKSDFQVHVGCSQYAEAVGLEKCYREKDIKFTVLPFARLKSWSPVALIRLLVSVRAVRCLVKEQGCDLLVTNTVRAAIVGSLAVRKSNEKLVWMIRDFTFPQRLFKFLSRYPTKVIFNSRAIQGHYQHLLKKSFQGEVVYPGRDTHKTIQKYFCSPLSLREEWGAINNEYVIGCTSRLVQWKGVGVLVRAIRELISQGENNLKCVIMGTGGGQEGSNEKELKRDVKRWGIESYVIFTGHKEEVAKYLHNFDIFVFPSVKSEAFGASVVDAMMARLPVVATRVGGVPEIIKHGVTGLLVEPGDYKQLAKFIKMLIKKKELREGIRRNGYKNAMNNFRIDITTRQLEGVYKEVIKV